MHRPVPESRSLLVCAICILLIGSVTGGITATEASSNSASDETYAVTQGDQCIEVDPFVDESQTVEEFYDYRNPITHDYPNDQYSSYGTTHLQEDDTSILLLYEGSDGLGLVMVHDQVDGDTTGGTATFEIEGLPSEGEWVQFDAVYPDDHYGGPISNYEREGTTSTMNWTWAEERTDGAAFRGGLEEDFEITIDPAFNDEAALDVENEEYQGTIDDWHVLSAVGDSHTRMSLESLEEPVTIAPGSCSSLTVASVTASPVDPEPGDDVDIQSTLANDGSDSGTFSVTITAEGEIIDERELSLDPGETEQITATTEFESEGTYQVAVQNTATTVTVEAEGDDDTDGGETGGSVEHERLPGSSVITALLAIAAAAIVVVYRRPDY